MQHLLFGIFGWLKLRCTRGPSVFGSDCSTFLSTGVPFSRSTSFAFAKSEQVCDLTAVPFDSRRLASWIRLPDPGSRVLPGWSGSFSTMLLYWQCCSDTSSLCVLTSHPSMDTAPLRVLTSHPSRDTAPLRVLTSHPSRDTAPLRMLTSHPSRDTSPMRVLTSHPSRDTSPLRTLTSHPTKDTSPLRICACWHHTRPGIRLHCACWHHIRPGI